MILFKYNQRTMVIMEEMKKQIQYVLMDHAVQEEHIHTNNKFLRKRILLPHHQHLFFNLIKFKEANSLMDLMIKTWNMRMILREKIKKIKWKRLQIILLMQMIFNHNSRQKLNLPNLIIKNLWKMNLVKLKNKRSKKQKKHKRLLNKLLLLNSKTILNLKAKSIKKKRKNQ